MEYLRETKVVIEKDTNKATTKEVLEPYEDESMEEFIERVTDKLREVYLDEYWALANVC